MGAGMKGQGPHLPPWVYPGRQRLLPGAKRKDWRPQLEVLGLAHRQLASLKLAELVTAFRQMSFVRLPGKHMSLPNNHARFAEVNRAFVELLRYFSTERGELRLTGRLLPGEVDTQAFQMVIPIIKGSASVWRRVVVATYRRRSLSMSARRRGRSRTVSRSRRSSSLRRPDSQSSQETPGDSGQCSGQEGEGSQYMVYWNYPGTQDRAMKLTLTVYTSDTLKVGGWSYYLWVLDCFPGLAQLVATIVTQQKGAESGEEMRREILAREESPSGESSLDNESNFSRESAWYKESALNRGSALCNESAPRSESAL